MRVYYRIEFVNRYLHIVYNYWESCPARPINLYGASDCFSISTNIIIGYSFRGSRDSG